MCIIFACNPNSRPTHADLETAWYNDPDGAGLAYIDNGSVVIRKGLMKFEDFEDAYNAVPDHSPLLIHMRIGTSGGYGKGVTHPFPVSTDLRKLHSTEFRCRVAVAHNGVLDTPTCDELGISDTVSYVMQTLVPLSESEDLVLSKRAKNKMKKTSAGSRLALLDNIGNMRIVGHGWGPVTDGVFASNDNWRRRFWRTYDYGWNDHDWDYTMPIDEFVNKAPGITLTGHDYWEYKNKYGETFPAQDCLECPYIMDCADYEPQCFTLTNDIEEEEDVLV